MGLQRSNQQVRERQRMSGFLVEKVNKDRVILNNHAKCNQQVR